MSSKNPQNSGPSRPQARALAAGKLAAMLADGLGYHPHLIAEEFHDFEKKYRRRSLAQRHAFFKNIF